MASGIKFRFLVFFVMGIYILPQVLIGQTFNGVGGLPFPPSGTIGITQSTCTVSGVGVLGGCTYIDNVTIDLNHTWVGDIALILIAPNGSFIELSSGNGGPGNDYAGTIFKDSAPINIVSGAPPFVGEYQAEGRQNTSINPPYSNAGAPGTFTFANTFNGINANGNWILYLNDYVSADAGFLNGWSITFVNGGNTFTVDLGPNQTVCAGQNITLTASNTAPNPISYLWNTGNTNPFLTIPNISSSGAYSVTVTDQSGCTATDNILITVTPPPTGNPVTLQRCESSPPGQAVFDLASIVSAIGNGLPVTFFTDIGLTNQIININAFISPSATIYAMTTQGSCNSSPIPITLQVLLGDPNLFSMNIVQEALCQSGLIEVQFTLPAPGVYTYNYTLNCVSGIETNSITTSANPIYFPVTENCILQINSITSSATGCTTSFNPPLTDNIIINNPPLIQVFDMEICQGQSINIADYVSTIVGATLTFHSSLPANSSNQLPSTVVNPLTSTTYYAQAVINNCESEVPVPVVVLPGGIPFNVTTSICENAGLLDLNQFIVPSSLTGVWSGAGVTGNTFNPQGLSGQIGLVFTPDDICYLLGTLNISIQPDVVLSLLSTDICGSDEPLDLNTLADPAWINGTWTGVGVNSNFFNPSGAGQGIFTLTFTPSNNCISPAFTSINVLSVPVPEIETGIVVCEGSTINLQDYINNPSNLNVRFYNNLPAVPANEIFNLSPTIFSDIQYYVKVTDANGCFGISPLLIQTTPGGIPDLSTATLCQSQNTYNLNLLNDPQAGAGAWSGPGVSNNILDLNMVSGSINLVFTPENDCFQTAETVVEVLIPHTPVLQSTTVCSTSGNLNLSALIDPLYSTGTWSGLGVTGNIFNPQGLDGMIMLIFDSDGFCINNAETFIDVKPTVTPELNTISICETTPSVDLSLLLDQDYTSGTWSGVGITDNIFISPGIPGINELTFTSSELCVLPSNTSITIIGLQTPQIMPIPLCQMSDPVNLAVYADPAFPTGLWTGSGVVNGFLDPENLSGQTIISFISDAFCTQPIDVLVTINTSPAISNIVATCDKTTNTFIVSFLISGGDSTTYMVNGLPSSNYFISDSFDSQSNYQFTVEDTNLCNTITVQGIKNCDCITSAGNMNFTNSPILVCSTGSAIAVFEGDQDLDDNDGLFFVLHDNNGPSLGNILAISKIPVFSFPPGGVNGATYYISAVAGDTLNNQLPDLNDLCLSVSAGVPVVFYQPTATLLPISDFCFSGCTEMNYTFTGQSPFTLITSLTEANRIVSEDTIIILNNNFINSFCPKSKGYPAGKYNLIITGFSDKNCGVDTVNQISIFTVYPERNHLISQSICSGDSLVINGRKYDTNNLSGTETIPTLISGQCDSTIIVDLTLIQPTEFFLSRKLCSTQSIIVNGNVYDINRPAGREILKNGNQFGCDSIIQINLTFTDEININYNPILCKGASVTVNGNIYDENRTSGTEVILSTNGITCDTVIFIQLAYNDVSIKNLAGVYCYNDTIYVNNKGYTRDVPFGTERLPAGSVNGCDSIINVNFTFLPDSKAIITDTLCHSDSIVINGITYNMDNPTGNTVFRNGSKTGCDSTVIVNLHFYPQWMDTVRLTLSKGDSVFINGVKFYENNRFGLTENPLLNIYGCKSYTYVIIDIEQEFITPDFLVSAETCPDENDGKIIVSGIKGCKNYTVKFRDSVFQNPVFPLNFNHLSPGSYTLEITGEDGCYYSEIITIDSSRSVQYSITKSQFTVEKGAESALNPGISPLPDLISWSPPVNLTCYDCPAPVFSGTEDSTEYLLTLANSEGCIFRFNISIFAEEKKISIVFPNIFSPDGDGQNDAWKVYFTNSEQIQKISIFDRWGNKVLAIQPQLGDNFISWDGTMDGKTVEAGVYIFVADVKGLSDKRIIKSGDVTIIR